MKTIKITEEKSINIECTFEQMLKLYELVESDDFKVAIEWIRKPKNWGKLISCFSIEEITESEAIKMISKCNSIKVINQISEVIVEHINAFYSIENKEESSPNA